MDERRSACAQAKETPKQSRHLQRGEPEGPRLKAGQEEAQQKSEETMDENNASGTAVDATERLQAAAERLEKTVAWLVERQAAMTGDVARIVATVDATADARQRELERKLEEAEQQIAELKAQAAAKSE